MATCPYCSGIGTRPDGYAPCNSCGGRGYAGFTNVACMACGGSGTSSHERRSTCWNCAGSGQVSSPAAVSSTARTARGGAAARPAKRPKAGSNRAGTSPAPPWTHWNSAFSGLAYVGGLAGLTSQTQLEGWQLFAAPVIPALVVGRLYKWCVAGLIALAAYYIYSQNSVG